MSGKTKEIWACDFETTTDPEDCRVWAWGASFVSDSNIKCNFIFSVFGLFITDISSLFLNFGTLIFTSSTPFDSIPTLTFFMDIFSV